MATIATLKKQIETLEKGINSPATPEMFKDGMRKNLEQKKSELEALESKGSTPKKSAPEKKKSTPKAAKPTPKAKATPAPTPKKSGGNPQMKEAAKLAKELREKDSSLTHQQAMKKAWEQVKGGSKKEDSGSGKNGKKRSDATKKKAKDLKTRVKSKLTPVPNQYKSGSRTHSRDKDRDGVRTAKRAGKRISKDGNVYYEYRENRADANIGRKSYRKPKLFAKGGEVDGHAKGLSMVEVKFADPKYNYKTNVSGNITEQEARKYFVGKMLDVGVYPKENMQKVVDIDFHPKGTYADGGSLGSEMYKIVDINGEDVHVNMTEKDVIEFADSLGYYDALDNDEEPIYDIDSATELIEMDGDYTVIKVSKEGDSFGRGGNTGNYNTGRSWHQDRNLFAQGQEYEVQYRKHRKA